MQDKSSDTDEWVEEEQMVVAELSGIIDPEYLSKCRSSNVKVLGIETEEPVLQLGSYIFTGQYKNMLGTAVVFEKKRENGAQGSENLQWKFKCHTDKKIEMQRAHLKSRQVTAVDSSQEAAKSSQETRAQTGEQPEGQTR